jgi:DNA-binding response OmpR family regulator
VGIFLHDTYRKFTYKAYTIEEQILFIVKKIFVIDDEPDILDAVKIVLEDEGFHVETSIKGDEIETRSADFPDLILLDVLLSGKDGRDIAKKLKNQEHTKHIPIIMMSAHPTAKQGIKEYLADDFIAKPFEIDYLLEKIRAYV